MHLFISIILAVLLLAFVLLLEKFMDKMFTRYEDLNSFIPLVYYGLSKGACFIQQVELFPYLIIALLIYNLAMLLHLCENTSNYISGKTNIRFIVFFFSICLSQILSYTVQFDILCEIDEYSFNNVSNIWYERTFDLFLYSLGIMFSNSIINITALSFYAKILNVFLLLSNVFLVTIFLGNYKEIGNIFQSNNNNK